MPIYSLQVEKHALGGLIRHSEMIPEVDGWLTEHDFYNDVHSTIFSVLVNCNKNGEKIDKVLLGQKIKNLGVSFKDEINIFVIGGCDRATAGVGRLQGDGCARAGTNNV